MQQGYIIAHPLAHVRYNAKRGPQHARAVVRGLMRTYEPASYWDLLWLYEINCSDHGMTWYEQWGYRNRAFFRLTWNAHWAHIAKPRSPYLT